MILAIDHSVQPYAPIVHDPSLRWRDPGLFDGGVPALRPLPDPNLGCLREVFNRHRADSEMTFDQLAEATGLSRRALLNIAGGESQGDLRTWLILARVWDANLDGLFEPVWNTPR